MEKKLTLVETQVQQWETLLINMQFKYTERYIAQMWIWIFSPCQLFLMLKLFNFLIPLSQDTSHYFAEIINNPQIHRSLN